MNQIDLVKAEVERIKEIARRLRPNVIEEAEFAIYLQKRIMKINEELARVIDNSQKKLKLIKSGLTVVK